LQVKHSCRSFRLFSRCPGVELVWLLDIGPFNDTFPWSRIGDSDDSLSFLIGVMADSQQRTAISKFCMKVANQDLSPCQYCAEIPAKVKHLADIASHANSHTHHNLLSPSQLRSHIAIMNDEMNHWKLRVCGFYLAV
jgi:hypothetical protein